MPVGSVSRKQQKQQTVSRVFFNVHGSFSPDQDRKSVVCEPKGKLGQGAEALLHFATHQIIHSCKSQTAEMKPSGLSVAAGFSVQKAHSSENEKVNVFLGFFSTRKLYWFQHSQAADTVLPVR